MRRFITSLLLLFTAVTALAQGTSNTQLYRPEEDADYELSKMILLAKALNRNVFVQVGGNWCAPCLRFHNFITSDTEISEILNTNYVIYHLNYSKENKNLPLMERFNNPQKLNFPVFLILDTAGRLLHTQRVMELVNSMGYDKQKVLELFNKWKPDVSSTAIKPKESLEE